MNVEATELSSLCENIENERKVLEKLFYFIISTYGTSWYVCERKDV
jgi:hypothetical protein